MARLAQWCLVGDLRLRRASHLICNRPERIDRLADRIARLGVRHAPVDQRKVAIVLFNFPPNSGATGTAAHLSVFESLFNTLGAMRDEGYTLNYPRPHEALRDACCRVTPSSLVPRPMFTRIPVDDHVRAETWLEEIEAQWGPAPGKEWSDGQQPVCFGQAVRQRDGRVFSHPWVTRVIPCGCCSRVGLAPTHAFSAFLSLVARRICG
jgi:magnesium chelatase subunit H